MWLLIAIIVAVLLLRAFLRRRAWRRGAAPREAVSVATARSGGLDLPHPLAVREVDRQFEIIDKLDAHAGVLLALAGAAMIWLLKDVGPAGAGPIPGRAWRYIGRATLPEHLAGVLFVLGIAALVVAFAFAFAALASRSVFLTARRRTTTDNDIDGRGLAIRDPDRHGLRKAYEANAELIAVKAGRFNAALWCGAVGVGGVATGLLVRGLFVWY